MTLMLELLLQSDLMLHSKKQVLLLVYISLKGEFQLSTNSVFVECLVSATPRSE